MGKYPVNISEEDNSKLKYPFLAEDEYESIYNSPDGTIIIIRHSNERLTQSDIERMVEINRDIAVRRIFSKQKNGN